MNKIIKSFSLTLVVMFISVIAFSQMAHISFDNEKHSKGIVFENNFEASIAGLQVSFLNPKETSEVEIIRWDDGTNIGNGVGLAWPGTWYGASRWLPSDLISYDDKYITSITFFPIDIPDAVFVLKVWVGENAGTEVMSQEIESYVLDSFNTILLISPVQIDASQELWFGYEVTQTDCNHPAGCDMGPAVRDFGDQISQDGVEWAGMYNDWGLDFNWNLAAHISETVGSSPIEVINRKEIAVYPNPATDFINISSPTKIQSITIYNSFGQLISVESIESKLCKLNTDYLESGVYLLQILLETEIISKRIIVE